MEILKDTIFTKRWHSLSLTLMEKCTYYQPTYYPPTYHSLKTLVSVFLSSFFFHVFIEWFSFLSNTAGVYHVHIDHMYNNKKECFPNNKKEHFPYIKKRMEMNRKKKLYLQNFHSIPILAAPPIFSTGATPLPLKHTSHSPAAGTYDLTSHTSTYIWK